MADAVVIPLKGDDSNLQAALGRSETNVNSFGAGVKKVLAALGVAVLIKGVIRLGKAAFSWGRKMLDLYKEQEKAEARITAVVKATGGAAGFTAQQMKDMASAMQNVTTIGDEVILGAQSILATFKNIRGDVFKDALMSAADLADILQTDIKGAALQVGKALNDPVKGMGALSRAGIQFTDSQKEMVKQMVESGDIVGAQTLMLDELKGQFEGTAKAAAETFGGRMESMKNRIGDVGEKIGEAIIPVLELIQPAVEKAVVAIENLMPTVRAFATVVATAFRAAFSALQPVFTWLVDTAILAFTAIQTAIENWRDLAKIAFKTFQLNVVRVFEGIKHLFTKQAPAWIKWLVDNWARMFKDMAEAIKQIVTNMSMNLLKFFMKVQQWMRGDFSGGFQWTGLLEGFESTLDELPKIAARKKGKLERRLEAETNDMVVDMAFRFTENLTKNRMWLKNLFTKPEALKMEDIIGDPLPIEVDVKAKDGDEADKDRVGQLEGLEALNRRITQAAAGMDDADKVAKAVKEAADRQVKAQEDAAKAIVKAQNEADRAQANFREIFKEPPKDVQAEADRKAEQKLFGEMLKQGEKEIGEIKNLGHSLINLGGLL
jgi:hypothetical protein